MGHTQVVASIACSQKLRLRLQQHQHLFYRCGQVWHFKRSTRFLGQFCRLCKIEGVRPHNHRAATGRRLDQVLPTQRRKTAAQQGHV